MWRILSAQTYQTELRYFARWRKRCKVPTLSPPQKQPTSKEQEEDEKREADPSEILSESNEGEENLGIGRPKASGKPNVMMFEGVIEANGEKLYGLLKENAQLKGGEAEAARKKISDICVDMAIEMLNSCLTHE